MALDVIDVKLIEVLQEDARISISELSKKINLSLSAVSERLKKLEASGVIRQYTAVIDAPMMGMNLEACVLVSVDGSGSSEFLKLVSSDSEILECSRITGEYDYILRIVCSDTSALQKCMDRIKRLHCVQKIHSDVILEEIKRLHSVKPVATK